MAGFPYWLPSALAYMSKLGAPRSVGSPLGCFVFQFTCISAGIQTTIKKKGFRYPPALPFIVYLHLCHSHNCLPKDDHHLNWVLAILFGGVEPRVAPLAPAVPFFAAKSVSGPRFVGFHCKPCPLLRIPAFFLSRQPFTKTGGIWHAKHTFKKRVFGVWGWFTVSRLLAVSSGFRSLVSQTFEPCDLHVGTATGS